MRALLRERVTDALPEPAVAACHQRDRSPEVHELSPACGCAVVWQRVPYPRAVCYLSHGAGKAVTNGIKENTSKPAIDQLNAIRVRALPSKCLIAVPNPAQITTDTRTTFTGGTTFGARIGLSLLTNTTSRWGSGRQEGRHAQGGREI
jgi:hypothetical protein